MGNCLVELYSLDVDSSYQHAFIYIRQLALHLRAAITKKTKESFQQIYAWQYFNCLRVWSAVIANNPETHELREVRLDEERRKAGAKRQQKYYIAFIDN